jgi:predicted metal-binding protein
MTELIVCSTCRRPGTDRGAPADGQRLLEAIEAALRASPVPVSASPAPLRVRATACMSGCSRACTVALQAAGKASYLFGELSPDAETAAQVLACARLHALSVDGQLDRAARPERLRNGILARLPALAGPD